MNEGVEISHEVAYSNNSLIEQQVTNGVAIRMALLYLIAGGKNR
jgi:aspartate carbamoyltransferase catalytic subunit